MPGKKRKSMSSALVTTMRSAGQLRASLARVAQAASQIAAYGLGGPAWLVYAGLLFAALAVLPGYARWDERQHPQ